MILVHSEEDVEKLKQIQDKKNILIRFMMNGCGWCEKTQAKWNHACKKAILSSDDAIVELEANFIDHFNDVLKHRKLNIDVRGFPTVMVIKGGKSFEPKQDIHTVVKMFQRKTKKLKTKRKTGSLKKWN